LNRDQTLVQYSPQLHDTFRAIRVKRMMLRIAPLHIALAFFASVSGALAQGAPLQLQPQRPPAAAAIARVAPPPKVASQDAAALIQKANAWFNSNATLVSDFNQVGADGRRTSGKLYVQKPGRLRFEYAAPATLEIVADGTSVAVRDKKLATQDLYFISQTPLKFLLKPDIDISRDTRILDVIANAQATTILIEDKATFGGTSRIKLIFDPQTSALRQWSVVDPQGFETLVTLSNMDLHKKPNPELFKINMERFN
jgi:outer membrane lipoprotein-sorting protein